MVEAVLTKAFACPFLCPDLDYQRTGLFSWSLWEKEAMIGFVMGRSCRCAALTLDPFISGTSRTKDHQGTRGSYRFVFPIPFRGEKKKVVKTPPTNRRVAGSGSGCHGHSSRGSPTTSQLCGSGPRRVRGGQWTGHALRFGSFLHILYNI